MDANYTKDGNMDVRTRMTKLVHSCGAEQSLHEAARVMWDHDCGCVPIVDGDGRLSQDEAIRLAHA